LTSPEGSPPSPTPLFLSRRQVRVLVISIVAFVAGIATLIVVGLTGNHQYIECEQEYKAVEAGLDAYMAYFDLTTVPTASTNNMASPVRLYNSAGAPMFHRTSQRTVYTYTWDAQGRITAISQSSGGPGVPEGCVVSG
jgi:YD repeat-containing protein